jgi:hypothetical protein
MLANARDVAAGFPDGRLNPGVLFRGDAPAVGDEPPPLPEWPPATVVDLRGGPEGEGPHPLADAAKVHVTPVLDAADPALLAAAKEAGDDRTLGVYKFMISTPDAIAGIVAAVEATAAGPFPVFVHCTAGKDRTGVVVALILRMLGFSRGDVVGEYLLTTANTDALADRLVERGITNRRPERTDALLPNANALELVLDAWDEHPGGPRGWFLEAGGSPRAIDALKTELAPAPEVRGPVPVHPDPDRGEG